MSKRHKKYLIKLIMRKHTDSELFVEMLRTARKGETK
jgi:hypothetical protein